MEGQKAAPVIYDMAPALPPDSSHFVLFEIVNNIFTGWLFVHDKIVNDKFLVDTNIHLFTSLLIISTFRRKKEREPFKIQRQLSN